MRVSKYQHFFLYTLLLTLLTGCIVTPLNNGPIKQQANEKNNSQANNQQSMASNNQYTQCEKKRLHLQQGKDALSAELNLAKKQIQQLETERDQLKAKLDALTAIEQSLHERKQRQSNH
ncbi:MAG TPA: hypothetical protein VJY63_02990 [Marinospirillum sp.]|uniref:hypothetical protein n=1 Tax=Marinospirillum sp. TaxID=2183934 RepID=UPI002B4734B5|nr:hypothetical protein [Marinospirillum sp.]HKM14879.1 hypothetical protein [Marinospirillum sp.]